MARRLIVEVVGDASSLQRAFGRSSAGANAFAGRMSVAGERLRAAGRKMTMGVTLPIVGIGYEATKSAMTFQSSMELLSTQANLPQKDIAALSKSVLGLAGPTATAPDTLAAGLYHLTSQGLRGAKSLEALRAAAQGAKMGQADLEDVTNALGAVLASKIGGVHSYGQAMGELNATVGAGDMRMQDLADAMGTGLPAKAAAAGVSLRDVSAALAVFGDNNIRGAAAGTLLNSTMRLMEGPSKASAKAMASIGLSAGELGDTLRNQGLPAALELLRSKMQGMSKTAQFQALTNMFGGRQAGGVMVLIDQLGRLGKKEEEVAKGGSSFAANWANYTQTTAYRMDKMGASMRAAGISIGDILLPVVSRIVNGIAKMADWFDRLSDPVKKAVLVFGGILAVVGPVVSVIRSLASVIGFLAANPIVLAIGALALLVGGMVAAVKAPKALKSALEKMGLSAKTSARIVRDLRGAASVAMRAIHGLVAPIRNNWGMIRTIFKTGLDIIRTTITKVTGLIHGIWDRFGGGLGTLAKTEWTYIKATIHNALLVIKGIFEVIDGLLHGNWRKTWQGIKDITRGSLGQVKAEFNKAKGLLIGVARLIGEGVKAAILSPIEKLASTTYNFMVKVGNGIGKGFTDGLQKAKSGFADMINTILINPINWVIKQLDKIHFSLPSWIPGIGGKVFGIHIPPIPTLDTGGKVAKTGLAVVHRGEIFSGTGSRRVAAHRTALAGGAAAPSSGPGSVSVVNNVYVGGRLQRKETMKDLHRHQKRGGKVTLNTGPRHAH